MTQVVVTATGAGSFTVPAGVTSIVFEAWGGGAGAGLNTTAEGSNGGGAYIKKTLAVTPGDIVYYTVGTGGAVVTAGGNSWFNLNTNSSSAANGAYTAGGGQQLGTGAGAGGTASNPSGGTGNQGAADASFSGGAGVAGQGGGGSRAGSGGGGGAGPNGAGAVGSIGASNTPGAGGAGNGGSTTGNGTSNVDGGSGGNGGASAANGTVGGAPGGAGGGGGNSGGNGAAGARGQIRYTYTVNSFTPRAKSFRFYGDGTEAGATAKAAETTDINLDEASGGIFQLRVGLQEIGGIAGLTTDDYSICYSKNGGGYVDITTSTANAVAAVNSSSVAEGDATTDHLSGLTGTFGAGKVSEDGTVDNVQLGASGNSELLFILQLVDANVTPGDVLDFSLKINGTLMTWVGDNPTITVIAAEYLYKGAGNRASSYKGAAANDSTRYLGTKAGIYAA